MSLEPIFFILLGLILLRSIQVYKFFSKIICRFGDIKV